MILKIVLPELPVLGKTQHLTGTITFIRLLSPQPLTVEKLDLITGKTQEILRATAEHPHIQTFRYSPDGQRFVAVMGLMKNEQANTEIYIGDNNSGKLERLTDNNIYDGWPYWSPDGKRIAFMRGIIRGSGQFHVLDIESQQEQQFPAPSLQIEPWVNWLPDSQRLIVVAKAHLGGPNEKEVYGLAELNLHKNTVCWLYKGNGYIIIPRLSPDGRRLVCVVQSAHPFYNKSGEPERINRVHVLDINTKKLQTVDDGPDVLERDIWPVWSPCGKRLAWIRSNIKRQTSKLLVCNLITKKIWKSSLPEQAADGYSLAWSPDGKHLACVTHRQRKNYTLRVVTLTSGKSREMLSNESQIKCLYWR